MEHSKMYDKIKLWFYKGLWSAEKVHEAYVKGLITEAEYEEIVNSKGES